jgi:hypothetical protein
MPERLAFKSRHFLHFQVRDSRYERIKTETRLKLLLRTRSKNSSKQPIFHSIELVKKLRKSELLQFL